MKGEMQETTSGREVHAAGTCPIGIIIAKFGRVWAAWELLTQKSSFALWVAFDVNQRENYWQFAVVIKGEVAQLCARKCGQMVLP